MDKNIASRVLGANEAEAFLSLVADLRDAMFLGELPDMPQEFQTAAETRLRYGFAPDFSLELKPVLRRAAGAAVWREAHRVKLMHILRREMVLL